MKFLKVTAAIAALASLLLAGNLFLKKSDMACLNGRDGHIVYTDNGDKMFISHTEIDDGIPLMVLCPK